MSRGPIHQRRASSPATRRGAVPDVESCRGWFEDSWPADRCGEEDDLPADAARTNTDGHGLAPRNDGLPFDVTVVGEDAPGAPPAFPALGTGHWAPGTALHSAHLLSVEAPRSAISELLGKLAPMVLQDTELYCVDGANAFDPYVFSRHARIAGVDPNAVLDRVMVTRAFTIHQLLGVVADLVPPLARSSYKPSPATDESSCPSNDFLRSPSLMGVNTPASGSRHETTGTTGPSQSGDEVREKSGLARTPMPMLAVLGLDHLFLEESLGAAERRTVLRMVLSHLGRASAQGMKMMVTYEKPPKDEEWWAPLKSLGDVRAVARLGRKGEPIEIMLVEPGR